MTIYPNAKINLGLNVTERRPDGYHNLETVFYPIPLCDKLDVTVSDGLPAGTDYRLRTEGIGIDCPPEKNLIIKVLRQLQADFDIPPLDIRMTKNIPSGAGLGGGSADAAAMMKLLNTMFRLGLSDEEMEARLSPLGADCAFFVKGTPTFATGIGNIFSPVSLSLQGWHLVLVKPDVFVSTKDAYSQICPHHPEQRITDIIREPVERWRDLLTNDFEEGIFRLHPRIGSIKDLLYRKGATYAAMSGSGSTVFGLFREEPPRLDDLPEDCFLHYSTL